MDKNVPHSTKLSSFLWLIVLGIDMIVFVDLIGYWALVHRYGQAIIIEPNIWIWGAEIVSFVILLVLNGVLFIKVWSERKSMDLLEKEFRSQNN